MICRRCKMDTAAHGTVATEQKFADGRVRLRETCRGCGGFLKWAQQGTESFGDRSVRLIEDLADLDVLSSPAGYAMDLVERAKELVKEARLGKIRK